MNAALTPAPQLYCSACEHTFPMGSGEACPRCGTRLIRLVGQKDPFIGRDLDGRYVILAKLGQGGMGAVYRGNQRSVDREVAIKVVNPHLMAEPEIIKRFLREARLASRLNHPNAVGVVDFGQTADGVFYLVMELVAGRTLEKILDDETQIGPDRAALIGAQICHALEGAHAIPIVHRDLKPANVLVDANDFVKVLDFGLAKSLSPDTVSSTMTSAGTVMGTPNFMPPEIAAGRPSDERADLYSLGCILYYAASGRLPFGADSIHEIMRLHAQELPPPLPEVPPDLAAVILRLLAKKPDDRFPTATATRLALEATIEGDHPPPTPWTDGSTIPIPVRRAGDDLDVSTVPRAAMPIHQRETLRPTSRGRLWPWVVAAVVAVAGVVAFFAIDPLGDDPRGVEVAPSSPVVAPIEPVAAPADPTVIPIQPAVIEPLPVAPPPIDEPEIEMPAISTLTPPTAKPPTSKPPTSKRTTAKSQTIKPTTKPTAVRPATRPAPPKPAVKPEQPPPPPF